MPVSILFAHHQSLILLFSYGFLISLLWLYNLLVVDAYIIFVSGCYGILFLFRGVLEDRIVIFILLNPPIYKCLISIS